MSEVALDDVNRGILFMLQQDARNTTIAEIAAAVEVSASTVRTRIEVVATNTRDLTTTTNDSLRWVSVSVPPKSSPITTPVRGRSSNSRSSPTVRLLNYMKYV